MTAPNNNSLRRRSGDNNYLSEHSRVTMKFAASVISLLGVGFWGWHLLDKNDTELEASVAAAREEVRYQFMDLRREINVRMADRWTRTDDREHMVRFASTNSLESIDHQRVTNTGPFLPPAP